MDYSPTRYHLKDYFNLSLVLLILLVLPLTVFLVKQQQEIRKRAQVAKPAGQAGNPGPKFVSNELLIKVKGQAKGKAKEGNPQDTGIASINNINKQFHVKGFARVAKAGKNSNTGHELFQWYKLTLDTPREIIAEKEEQAKSRLPAKNPAYLTLQRLIGKFRQDSNIEAAQLNYIVTAKALPNDPYYSSSGSWGQPYDDLWGLKKINVEQAWDQTTGSSSIIVADIDTGVDRNHEDISTNMWVNIKEIPNNGIDDDGNGYVDDYYGWDWVSNTNDPMDDMGHGTHTAGTIAAAGNNGVGVVGVNWKSSIMALKFLDNTGNGVLDNAAIALQYAADMGARVSSNSYGCGCKTPILYDAIKYEHDRGMVIVVAAGNDNFDALDDNPSSVVDAITVAASDHNDLKSDFSNFGEKIDVAAPGGDSSSSASLNREYNNILSLRSDSDDMYGYADNSLTNMMVVGTKYYRARGTSMATPHAAGLAALLLAKNPSLSNEEIRQIIRIGADDIESTGRDNNSGYGRINAGKSMNQALSKPLAPYIWYPISKTAIGGRVRFAGSVDGSNFSSFKIQAVNEGLVQGAGKRTFNNWQDIHSSNAQVTSGALATIDTTQLPDGTYAFKFTAIDTAGKNYDFEIYDIEIDNFDIEISSPNKIVSKGINDVVGTIATKNGTIMSSYKLEWGVGKTPTSWSTDGISLTNGGTAPVNQGLLGKWDTSALADGQEYSLRLTVANTTSVTSAISNIVVVDKDLVNGWPKIYTVSQEDPGLNSEGSYCPCIDSPVFADINDDGIKEMATTIPDGRIDVLSKNGSSLAGFPVLVDKGYYINNPPAVEDLDGDGQKEIIVSATKRISTQFNNPGYDSTYDRKIYIYKSNGTPYPGWPNFSFVSFGLGSHFLPTVADLNNDGKKDLIFLDNTGKLHAIDLTGVELPGFPVQYADIIDLYTHPVSVADLNGDSKLEIVFDSLNKIYVYDNGGYLLSGWPFSDPAIGTARRTFTSTPSIADVNGDGKQDIVVMGHIGWEFGNTNVYVLNSSGTLLPNWPQTVGQALGINKPSLVDLDNDGKYEIILGSDPVAIFNGDGTSRTIANPFSAWGQPALADLDGDGKIDLVTSFDPSITTIDTVDEVRVSKEDGTVYLLKTLVPLPPGDILSNNTPVVSDMDSDGKIELAYEHVEIFYSGSLDYLYNQRIPIYLWEVPTTSGSARYEWPMFGHDPQRTGRLAINNNAQPPSPTIHFHYLGR